MSARTRADGHTLDNIRSSLSNTYVQFSFSSSASPLPLKLKKYSPGSWQRNVAPFASQAPFRSVNVFTKLIRPLLKRDGWLNRNCRNSEKLCDCIHCLELPFSSPRESDVARTTLKPIMDPGAWPLEFGGGITSVARIGTRSHMRSVARCAIIQTCLVFAELFRRCCLSHCSERRRSS